MEKISVILADSSREQLQNLSAFFTNEQDITVVGKCTDGSQLLNVLKSIHVDFLILDVFLPKIDGLKVLEEIIEIPESLYLLSLIEQEKFSLIGDRMINT